LTHLLQEAVEVRAGNEKNDRRGQHPLDAGVHARGWPLYELKIQTIRFDVGSELAK
jgi:hypothetical protein